jgi:hypothetical protein
MLGSMVRRGASRLLCCSRSWARSKVRSSTSAGTEILQRGVGHDGIEQHRLCRSFQALAGHAEAPALQARDLEVQRLDPGLLEPEFGLHALDQIAKFLHRVGSRCRVAAWLP